MHVPIYQLWIASHMTKSCSFEDILEELLMTHENASIITHIKTMILNPASRLGIKLTIRSKAAQKNSSLLALIGIEIPMIHLVNNIMIKKLRKAIYHYRIISYIITIMILQIDSKLLLMIEEMT